MKDNKGKSIISDALTDYNAIVEAANANAMKKLAIEFPNKFNSLINEELNKNKSKESYTKVKDNDKESDLPDGDSSNKESDMKKQKEETKKVDENEKGAPFEEKATVEETVVIKDTVGDDDPFTEKAKGKKAVEETVVIKDTVGDDDPFTEKAKGSKGKSNIEEAFDISGLDMNSVEETLDAAGEEDTISFEDIEEEISQLEGLEEELQGMDGLPRPKANFGTVKGRGGDTFTQLIAMKNQIDEMIGNLGGEQDSVEQTEEMPPDEFDDISLAEAEEEVITDADIDSVLNGSYEEEEPVEEALGVSHATNKISTAHNPRKEYASSPAAAERRRPSFQNESKRVSGLVSENKKLTKKLNEMKKSKESVITLVESYKTALGKYRNQLKEMAVFNTNLAHVNNLLVNEEIALTQSDKVKIINEFKKVGTITESQNKYKGLLSEMSGKANTISESLEGKVSTSIQPSSKQKLDEVVEKTAYTNNEHIKKMMNIVEYMEKRGKKL